LQAQKALSSAEEQATVLFTLQTLLLQEKKMQGEEQKEVTL
jgi:hypothetical protein